MSSKKYNNNRSEIRIRNVPKQIRIDLENIRDHSGETISSILRSKLPDIIDSYPPHYKDPLKED